MSHRNPPHSMPSDRTPDRAPVKQRPDEQRIDGVQMSSIPKPTPTACAKAQLNLAAIALEQPYPQAWLAEVLNILGLRRRQPVEAGHDPRDPNRPDQEARRVLGI